MAAWSRLPATGSLRSTESSHARPWLERRSVTKLMTATKMTPPMAHHHVLTKAEMLRSIRVGNGSFAFNDEKKVRNLGNTKVARTMTVTTAITATTAG